MSISRLGVPVCRERNGGSGERQFTPSYACESQPAARAQRPESPRHRDVTKGKDLVPREKIDYEFGSIEHVSVLDEHGNVDTAMEPKLSSADLKRCYRAMLQVRRLDERMLKMQRSGRMGTFAPCRGQEAASIGSVFVHRDGDWLVPSYREPGSMFWVGWPLESFLLYWNGSIEGAHVPEGVNSLPVAVPVGSQPLHATGIGYAMKYANKKNLVICYFGDGATSEGDVLEAMNYAGVWKAPVLFVCQNNQYAISMPRTKQTNSQTIAQKAVAFGFTGVHVDGNDILAMIVASTEAAERARSGQGPTLIEAETYRLSLHTTADDPTKYRKSEEVDMWEKRDPLVRFENYLRERKILDTEQIERWQAEIEQEIKDAIKKMDEVIARASILDVFDHLYAEPTPDLIQQRAECAALLEAGRNA